MCLSKSTVFFGGAGVSTESGIPDFRSASGLFCAELGTASPESILHRDFFFAHTDAFYRFYREHMVYTNARPNSAHKKLAELERAGKLTGVITQNIDGLHIDAGSVNVLELHGSVRRNFCIKCGRQFPLLYIIETQGVPYCACGGIVKPDVVLYGEALDDETITKSVSLIRAADTLIVGGTSLAVYPAAGLIDFFRGSNLILINKSETPRDAAATLRVFGSIGEILGAVKI